MRLTRIVEGQTELMVPQESIMRKEPPTHPVFFNPAARVNRDISVAICSVSEGRSFADLMTGTGARAIRIARESRNEISFLLNDINKRALYLARRNAELNGVIQRCRFSSKDANELLTSMKDEFDLIDVDPFGTPASYLFNSIYSIRENGILSLTATDTAVLCGKQRNALYRRYGAKSFSSTFCHETGIRILVAYACRLASSIDTGVVPLFSHSTRHYLRVYLRVVHKSSAADSSLRNIGYIMRCKSCREIFYSDKQEKCIKCGSETESAGPLWLSELHDEQVTRKALTVCKERGFMEAWTTMQKVVLSSGLPPFSFSVDEACSELGIKSVSPLGVIELLKNSGYSCAAQPYERKGIKVNASYGEFLSFVKEASLLKPLQKT